MDLSKEMIRNIAKIPTNAITYTCLNAGILRNIEEYTKARVSQIFFTFLEKFLSFYSPLNFLEKKKRTLYSSSLVKRPVR